MLQHAKNVQGLQFPGIQFDGSIEACTAMAGMLRHHTSLREISFGYCRVSKTEGGTDGCAVLLEALATMPHLTKLAGIACWPRGLTHLDADDSPALEFQSTIRNEPLYRLTRNPRLDHLDLRADWASKIWRQSTKRHKKATAAAHF